MSVCEQVCLYSMLSYLILTRLLYLTKGRVWTVTWQEQEAVTRHTSYNIFTHLLTISWDNVEWRNPVGWCITDVTTHIDRVRGACNHFLQWDMLKLSVKYILTFIMEWWTDYSYVMLNFMTIMTMLLNAPNLGVVINFLLLNHGENH